MKFKRFMEISILTAAAMLLFISEFFVMPVTAFLIIVSPVPFMIMSYRFGAKKSTLAAFLSSLFFVILTASAAGNFDKSELLPAAIYLLIFAVTGIFFGQIALKSKSAAVYIYNALPVSVLTKILLMAVSVFLTGTNPFSVDEAVISSFAANLNSAAFPAKFDAGELISIAKMLMPSMLFCFAAADSFLSYILAGRILRLYTKKGFRKFPAFESWKMPTSLGFAIFAGLIFTGLEYFYPQNVHYKTLSLNFDTILRMIFAIEGLSVVCYFINRKVMKILNWPVKLLVIISAVITTVPIAVIGIFDIWYDIRKIGGGNNESNS